MGEEDAGAGCGAPAGRAGGVWGGVLFAVERGRAVECCGGREGRVGGVGGVVSSGGGEVGGEFGVVSGWRVVGIGRGTETEGGEWL